MNIKLISAFKIPLITFAGIILYLITAYVLKSSLIALIIAILTIALGSFQLFQNTYESITKKQFALDYIAILAIIVSLITQEYLVGAVIALMIASGRTLEEYGAAQAKSSLTSLTNRIPRTVFLWKNNQPTEKIKIENVDIGDEIFIRKGEVIPLDGTLITEKGYINESSLTGEAYPVEKLQGDEIRSGTINMENPLVIKVTREEKDSTYKQIINLVQKAEKEKAPLVRLADKYSAIFTLITFVIATFAFLLNKNLESILAVLVVATPCPLILATPIALLGGVNASAKRRIIVKRLSSLEILSRVDAIMFDKTGTITLGRPKVTDIKIFNNDFTKEKILEISEAIERNSLHPLAKAIVRYASEHTTETIHAKNISEIIGEGISGEVEGKEYNLTNVETQTKSDMAIALFTEKKLLAVFSFEDQIKEDSASIISRLKSLGLEIAIFTGDKYEVALRVAQKLGGNIMIEAECSPEDKQNGIKKFKKAGKVTAMVGDGINDAPALALADVGLVFSNEEQTAASEAADIIFLHGDFSLVIESITIAKRTIRIAVQSITWGIGLSILAMIAASFGLIPPLYGAILQEAIDVTVILNALRASR